MNVHLSSLRLYELSNEAVKPSPEESQHLKICYLCMILLRQFADDRREKLEKEYDGRQSA